MFHCLCRGPNYHFSQIGNLLVAIENDMNNERLVLIQLVSVENVILRGYNNMVVVPAQTTQSIEFNEQSPLPRGADRVLLTVESPTIEGADRFCFTRPPIPIGSTAIISTIISQGNCAHLRLRRPF